jgi:predicted GNAT family acetyltransferase
MVNDKTGAPTSVTADSGKYDIAIKDSVVGHAFFADRGDQRVFYHTEVDDEFSGRGLATILIEQALRSTREHGKRIVAVCPTVAKVLEKHPEFREVSDPVTPEIKQWVQGSSGG